MSLINSSANLSLKMPYWVDILLKFFSVILSNLSTHCANYVVLFVCVEVLRPSQPNVVLLSTVSLPNHTFTGQA